MSDHPFAAAEAAEIEPGAVEAKRLADAIASGHLKPAAAWLAFIELQARHGKNSPACMSYVIHLAKRIPRKEQT